MLKKLIVTADDYGMSRGVNDAIDAGIACGLITSTNVMTNMEYYWEAGKLRNMNVSVGIHWNVSAGKPVSDPGEIKTLVRADGSFFSGPEFRSRYRKGLITKEDIIKELKAQYLRFTEVCGEPDYWNTHQNTHVGFGVYSLFVDAARELGICRMRSHQRIYVPGSDNTQKKSLKWRLAEPAKSRLLNIWQYNAHKKGIASPDGLIVCLNKGDEKNLKYTLNNIRWKNKEIGEYVIHPATVNDSPYFGKIVEQRITEWQQFTSEETCRILQENEIELVDFLAC